MLGAFRSFGRLSAAYTGGGVGSDVSPPVVWDSRSGLTSGSWLAAGGQELTTPGADTAPAISTFSGEPVASFVNTTDRLTFAGAGVDDFWSRPGSNSLHFFFVVDENDKPGGGSHTLLAKGGPTWVLKLDGGDQGNPGVLSFFHDADTSGQFVGLFAGERFTEAGDIVAGTITWDGGAGFSIELFDNDTSLFVDRTGDAFIETAVGALGLDTGTPLSVGNENFVDTHFDGVAALVQFGGTPNFTPFLP